MATSNLRSLFWVMQLSAWCIMPIALVTSPPAWASARLVAEVQKLTNEAKRDKAVQMLQQAGSAAIEPLLEVIENRKAPLKNRLAAIATLSELGSDAELAVPALSEALSDRNAEIRSQAARTLGEIGPKAKASIPELIVVLKDPNEGVRISAANALSRMGSAAKSAVPALLEALEDSSQGVKSNAIAALSGLGSDAKNAVPKLVEALADDDEGVRQSAITALGRLGPEAKTAVPALSQALHDPDKDIRLSAITALGRIGEEAGGSVEELVKLLQGNDRELRSFAALSLGRMREAAAPAVPDLMKVLADADKDVRLNAAAALGRIGYESQLAVPALTETLKDTNMGVRLSAAAALARIAGGLQDQATQLSRADLTDAMESLEKTLPILEDPSNGFNDEVIVAVKRSLTVLKSTKDSQLFERTLDWSKDNPAIALIGLYVLATPAFWVFILLVRPLWLLKLNDLLKPYTDFELPTPLGNTIKVPLRFVMFMGWFHYHPRVLDAWVEQQVPIARDAFAHKTTVSDRAVYIPIPVVMQGNTFAELTSQDMHSTFWDGRQCLLIWGEGGIGKTSLACNMAKWAMAEQKEQRLCRHRMIPVLLEQELDFKVPEDKDPFREAIRGQLQALVDSAEPLSDEFIEKLLRQRRILVIVDRLSELSEATRQEIRPGHPDFPANALIVTSRVEETLDGVPKTIVRPMRIEGNRLSSFLEAYLTQCNKRELFKDSEYFDACSQLSKMVGQRNITVLLAKLYAEQMISTKDHDREENLPDNIPDLMLSYLNELNRNHNEDEPDNPTIHQDSKIIAWECLKQSFRPAPARRETILMELETQLGVDSETAKARLKHLEKRLRILHTVGPAQDQICFALDPLAECLAALHLVELYGNEAYLWADLLLQADAMPGAPESIQGFLLALRDCCLSRGVDMDIPEFILDELGRRVGLSAELLRRAQVEQRLARLAPRLQDELLDSRLRAIRELSDLGGAAKPVLPGLVKAFQDDHWQVRQEAIRAVGQIGAEARSAIPALVERIRDSDRRISGEAIAALGKIGTVAIPALISALESKVPHVRSSAAWVLASFESNAKIAVPALTRCLQDEDWQVRWVAAYALGAIGAEAKEAVPALIAACKGELSLVRQEASRALWRINGEEASAIVTALS
ncbi:HEAT repeat domain-containing protein [Alkalinema pantanalense CENA528]|uniref:HEAT repeat domain-containing protein n=1 Tax=Alkalinema pantanalense TaxID=1620705 RepID=UPI003D6F1C8F